MAVATSARTRKPRGGKTSRWVEDPEVGLMLRVQEDDAGAFAELVRLYWTRIFGQFYRQLCHRQEAEDLTQDVFLRVYRHRKRYEPRAKFATWLFHISQNVARNALRSRRRRPCLPLAAAIHSDDGYLLPGPLPSQSESPSHPLEQAELACVVREAISGLADRQRTAMELHEFEDRTYAEIAAEMDMSPKAAKSLLYRARNQLRAALMPFVETQA